MENSRTSCAEFSSPLISRSEAPRLVPTPLEFGGFVLEAIEETEVLLKKYKDNSIVYYSVNLKSFLFLPVVPYVLSLMDFIGLFS